MLKSQQSLHQNLIIYFEKYIASVKTAMKIFYRKKLWLIFLPHSDQNMSRVKICKSKKIVCLVEAKLTKEEAAAKNQNISLLFLTALPFYIGAIPNVKHPNYPCMTFP